MRRILTYIRPYLWAMLGGFCIKFIGTIVDLGIPWALAHIIDKVIPTRKMTLIFFWGFVMLLFSITAVVGNVIANRMASAVARDVTRGIRHDLFTKILSLSASQVDSFTLPSLVSRMTTDTYNIHHAVGMVQRIGVRAPVLLVGSIFVMLTLDVVLTLVLIVVIPLIGLVVYVVTKRGVPLYRLQQQGVDHMVRTVREDAAGIRVIKALSKTDYEKKHFEKINKELVERETTAAMNMAVTNPLMNLFLNVGLALVILVGAFRVNNGATEVGVIVAFTSYFTIMLNAMLGITRIFVTLSKAIASSDRIAEVLETPEELTVGSAEKYPGLEQKNPDIYNAEDFLVFDSVSFAYVGQKENNLEDISFSLKKGESLGIIGSTGSGKTTLLALLLRLYDVTEGGIYLEGKDIRSIERESLRSKFGIVFQNDLIFAETVRENIRFGRELSEEEVRAAVESAQAKEFVEGSEDGYEKALYARGNNLSGGQKQRILLSRALAGKPEILVLDDSSSALDYKTDANLRKVLCEKYADTTKIMVAQRISAVMYLDHILVLEDGRIRGYGTHEELLKNCEVYQEIYDSQLG